MSTRGDAVLAGGELLHSKARARPAGERRRRWLQAIVLLLRDVPSCPQSNFDAVCCLLSHATLVCDGFARRKMGALGEAARPSIAPAEPPSTAEEHYQITRGTLGAIAKIRAGSEVFSPRSSAAP